VLGTDLFLYSLGRLGGRRLLRQKYVQKVLKPERIQTFSRKFQEKGVWFMLTARLIPGWRTAVFITAGSIHYPIDRFILADAISSIPLVTFFFFGGYFAADWINELIGNLHHVQYQLLFLAVVAVLIVGLIVYVRWMRKRQEEEAVEEAEEHVKLEQEKAAVVGTAGDEAPQSVPAGALTPSANGLHAPLGAADRPVNTKP
jgi:membrane protein DedA with SNARE-associated domain